MCRMRSGRRGGTRMTGSTLRRRRHGWWAAALFAAFVGGAAPLHADEAADPAPVAITTADLKGVSTPSADDLAKGDPGGTLTGSAADIVMADPKAGPTSADFGNRGCQNRI